MFKIDIRDRDTPSTKLVHTPRGVLPLLRLDPGNEDLEDTVPAIVLPDGVVTEMPMIDFADLDITPVSTPKPAVFESPDEAIAWLETEWAAEPEYLDPADVVEDTGVPT